MLSTSLGDIVIDLHTDRCPLTTKNFLKLCKIKYYNNCLFHSVQKDFIAQTGDPSGKGTGGDSIYKFLYGEQARFFGDEIHPDLKHTKVGTVAMASGGENLNASQFYITLREELDYLDGKHTVFGEIAEGLDTLMRINEAFVDEKGRPYKNIRIKHAYILDDPFDDPSQLVDLIPVNSPEQMPLVEGEEVRLEDDWIPMDEQQDPEELEKSLRRKEAQSRAVVLEMVGDIPEAEIKPPENVLFVCKLNPVTQEEDLEVIFSRFGKVISADIIRDYKTGDSLCYAFIEFETQEACEAAYFKMDNVLIDDRRIHVDFSQSVSKIWNQYRHGGKKNMGEEGKGHGCFKCGEEGHIAKDCLENTNEAPKDAAPEKPKYVLKDTNRQHGDTGKSYDMIFEEDLPATSNRRFQHEDYRQEKTKELKSNVKEADCGSKERGEPDHYHRDRNDRTSRIYQEERGNKSRERDGDRESRGKRDIDRYRDDNERQRYREDRQRDKSTNEESRNRDRPTNDKSRSRDRSSDFNSRSIDRSTDYVSRNRDRSTDYVSRNRDRYGEDRDQDKYTKERESNRYRERKEGHRDREEEEIEDRREKERYKAQRESEIQRDKSCKEFLRNDTEKKRQREDKKEGDRKDYQSERHREDQPRKRHEGIERGHPTADQNHRRS
ncbi:hypothetical protein SUGI_1135250 [Cryptomeria japonica]|nr:hypothetical protein SUGI_1135250 [Cryptomeria japonica]